MQVQQSHNPHSTEIRIGAFEARRKFGRLIEEVYYHKDAVVVERSGRPMAVIVSVDEYKQLKKLARDTLFQMIEEVWERNRDIPAEELERDVEAAIAQLHEENRQRKNAA